MRIETLIIGDELLDGRVVDTNSVRLAALLQQAGHKLVGRTTVVDDIEAIVGAATAIAGRHASLCIVAGGLGPTDDDLTVEAFARLTDDELSEDPEIVERLRETFEARGRTMTPNQLRQARRPQEARRLDNPYGTAPGFSLEFEGCTFMALPGVPREFNKLVERHVLPMVLGAGAHLERRILRSFGLIEGVVEERLRPVLEKRPEVRVGYRAHFPEIEVSLSCLADASSTLEAAAQACEEALSPHVFSFEPGPFAGALVHALRSTDSTIVLAESCTGGLIGDLITDVNGSSAVFLGGLQAYSNEVKERELGVAHETLIAHGAVSEATVTEMAEGIRRRFSADWSIAVSGIAGPGGGSVEKPVGTVWLAVSGPDGTETKLLTLPYDRRRNKVASAHAAVDFARRLVQSRRIE